MSKFALPVEFHTWDKEKLYQALTLDKKARGNQLKLVLVPEIGTCPDPSSPVGRNERLLTLESDKGDSMRYLTAGESHGPRLTAIIEGVPAGLPFDS